MFSSKTAFFSASRRKPMILQYNVGVGGTIRIPIMGPVDAMIVWGDGNSESITTSGVYSKNTNFNGTLKVKIYGNVYGFGQPNNWGGEPRLEKVISWGNIGLQSLSYAFQNPTPDTFNRLTNLPNDIPSNVTNISGLFFNNITFLNNANATSSLATWNTSNLTDISYCFYGRSLSNLYPNQFNGPITSWDTSNVTTMYSTFYGANSFNQNISGWNTSKVANLGFTFALAGSFNQNIGTWNVGNTLNLASTFTFANNFNQNLSSWVTGLTSQPSDFSTGANAVFANNASLRKPFLSDGVTRINT